MSNIWKKIRYRLEVAGLTIMTTLLPRLPHSVILRLARLAGSLVFALDTHNQKVALANLEAVFGDRYLPSERKEIALRSIQNFARAFLDLFWSQNLNPENFSEWIDLQGFGPAQERRKTGSAEIFISHHFGNFEFDSLGIGYAGFALQVITQDFKNPAITPIFAALRNRSGHLTIPRERAVLRLLKELKRGGLCGFLVDLSLKLDEPGVLIDTFGMKKWVTSVQVLLAQRTGAFLNPTVCIPLDDGRYELRCLPALQIPPNASPQEATQLCWDVLEPFIKERPELWMWAYKHWRYRPEGADNYPFYANASGKFQRILDAAPSHLGTGQPPKPVHNNDSTPS